MTDAKSFDIDSRKLFNLGANLLIAGFVKQKTEEAKKLFKELKQGVLVPSGHLSSEKTGIKLPIKLQLERSEYRGQFNFPNFEASLKIMLQKFENVPLFSSPTSHKLASVVFRNKVLNKLALQEVCVNQSARSSPSKLVLPK